MMSSVLSNKMLEAIRRTATELPPEVARRVAEGISPFDSHLDFRRTTVIHALGQPHFRDSVSSLLNQWDNTDPDSPGEVIGAALMSAIFTMEHVRKTERIELLWTGPDTNDIPLRRTDQALIQLIRSAKRTVTIVSFAVYKFGIILTEISDAIKRGVDVRLILESQSESEEKISFDMLGSVIKVLPKGVKVYVWPLGKRPRDQQGRHGSLHAKCAVADSEGLFISSANLTEYAFSLNMEMGILVTGGNLPDRVQRHFVSMIEAGIIALAAEFQGQ